MEAGLSEESIINLSISSFVLVFVRKTYSASSAAPSASTTRLVSSLEICKASARCMSVMVQKEATRWSGDRTGEKKSHNLPKHQKQEMRSATHFLVSTSN